MIAPRIEIEKPINIYDELYSILNISAEINNASLYSKSVILIDKYGDLYII